MFVKKSQTSYEGRNRGPDVMELPASMEDFHNSDGSVSQVVTVHLQVRYVELQIDDEVLYNLYWQ